MARTRRRVTPAPVEVDDHLPALLDKARAVAARSVKLRRDFEGVSRLAHQAQVREAVTRTELTEALTATLAGRAEMAVRVQAHAWAAYLARAGRVRLRRHNRISRMLDRLLARLGPWGQALVIARSGVWRGTGAWRADLAEMAAYARRRADPAARPRALFDQAWRLAESPDLAAAGMAPLVHYLIAGAREGREPHPLFESGWYGRDIADELNATGLSGLEHYARTGAACGRSPHPLFDVAHYLAQEPVLARGEDPLSHYVREGGRLGLSPHPLFDPAWYAAQAPEAAGGPSLIHYLATGSEAGLSPHPLFDPKWYLVTHAEAAETGVEPLIHFVVKGAFEGLDPSPWFDLHAYAETRPDELAPGVNPLIDYLRGGAWIGIESQPGFPTAAYVAARPDLARDGLTPLEHWARRQGR